MDVDSLPTQVLSFPSTLYTPQLLPNVIEVLIKVMHVKRHHKLQSIKEVHDIL